MEKSQFLIGKPSINGSFSMPMLNNQTVNLTQITMKIIIFLGEVSIFRCFSLCFSYAFPMVLALRALRRPRRGRYSIQAIEFNRAEKMNLLGSSGWRRGKLHLEIPLLVVNSG